MPPDSALFLMLALVGVSLCGMLMSCQHVCHTWAICIMNVELPLQLGPYAPRPHILVIAISGLIAYISRLQWGQWENRYRGIGMEVEKNLMMAERNFWRSLLVFVVWCLAARLKSLAEGDEPLLKARGAPMLLGPTVRPSAPGVVQHAVADAPQRGVVDKMKYSSGKFGHVVWAAASFLLADIPLTRVNYHTRLQAITEEKMRISEEGRDCDGVRMNDAHGECLRFCKDVQGLSKSRQEAMLHAREGHPLGNFASLVFECTRGRSSDPASSFSSCMFSPQAYEPAARRLFEHKSCCAVLESVDKSNELVNYSCWVLALVGLISFLVALTRLFESDRKTANRVPQGEASRVVRGQAKGAAAARPPDTGPRSPPRLEHKDKFN